MNISNQNLLKLIKIFFKTIYILVIALFCFSLLGQILAFTFDTEGIGALPYVHIDENPEIQVSLFGKPHEAKAIYTLGVINIKEVPVIYRIFNAASSLAVIFFFIVILRIVLAIVRSIDQNEVFSIKNSKRLNRTGWLLLFVFVISNALILFGRPGTEDISFPGKIMAFFLIVGESVGHIVAMVFTFFMASVFRIGVTMQEENESFV